MTQRNTVTLRRAGTILFATSLLCGCIEFSPPVREDLLLRLMPDGGVEVRVETLLSDPRTSFQSHERARARIQEVQDDALAQRDPWTRRFARAEWTRDSLLLERACGHLLRVRREGTLADPAKLSDILRDLPLSVSYSEGGGEAELSLAVQGPPPAGSDQRAELDSFLERWVPHLRAYLRAEADLYAYLDANPGRARDLFGMVFEGCGAADEGEKAPEPEGSEKILLERLSEAMGEVVSAIEVPKEEAYSPDELSRLCYDPLPVPLTVEVPGVILDAEGFERQGANRVVHRGKSLWTAVERLSGRWVSPDILCAAVACLLREGEERRLVDVEAFSAGARTFAEVPSEEELRRAIEEALGPEPVYRVRWRQPAVRGRSDG